MKKTIALFAAVVLAVPLLAQTHSETITVEVIDVPVYVYGAQGPVRDLTKADFELFVNGKRQQIDYFDPIEFSTAPSDAQKAGAAPHDVRERRLFLLILDCVFSRPAALDRARKAAVAMIDGAGPSDYFAIATFSVKNGAQLLIPFTNDHTVARRAALALQPSAAHDPLAIAISANEREYAELIAILNNDSAGPRGGSSSNVVIEMLNGHLTAGQETASMPAKRLIEDQFTDFTSLASRLTQLQGYKHVVLMSEGVNPYLVYQNEMGVDPQLVDAMNKMAAAFRASGAVVDTVDLGLPAQNSVMNDALHLIAHETGGQFIHHENDLKVALDRISTSSAVGYRLGFKKPHDAKKGDNAIDVKVRNLPSGARVSFRRGFSTTVSALSNTDGLRLADVILNDVPQTGIAPRIQFGEKPYIEVHVPAREMLAVNNGVKLDADLLFYVFDAKGAVVEFKQKRIAIPSDAHADLVVRDALKLPSGAYVAKALLRVGDSLGFVRQNFAIP
jgi:VWFA-related protein